MWAELKRKEVEYEKRRNKKVQYYESVRHAQTVQIDDIPLPQMTDQPPPPPQQLPFTNPPRIPLPEPVSNEIGSNIIPPPVGPTIGSLTGNNALKRPASEAVAANEEESKDSSKKEPPGCPPGPPPDLFEMHELDSDYEEPEEPVKTADEKTNEESASADIDLPKPTSVQQRILAIAGQKYDDFMKELENVHSKKKEKERSLHPDISSTKKGSEEDDDSDDENDSNKSRSDTSDSSDETDSKEDKKEKEVNTNQRVETTQPNETTIAPSMPPQPTMPMPPVIKLPSGPPPPPIGMPPMMFRPPPMRPGMKSIFFTIQILIIVLLWFDFNFKRNRQKISIQRFNKQLNIKKTYFSSCFILFN